MGEYKDAKEEENRKTLIKSALSKAKEIEEQLTSKTSENYQRILEAENTINDLDEFIRQKKLKDKQKFQKKIAGGVSFVGAIAVGAMYFLKSN
mmetsp:Transcript_8587/g.8091  ORF Transcript_8587/g.8091 Transcript_8587/m.8091 type:complete len:93 (-) Transcript_8587:58-336(-)